MDTDISMSDNEMEVDIKDDLMELFEQSIADFMAVEQIHTEILEKLHAISTTCTTYDFNELQKLHLAAMEHIKATGSSNFGSLLLNL